MQVQSTTLRTINYEGLKILDYVKKNCSDYNRAYIDSMFYLGITMDDPRNIQLAATDAARTSTKSSRFETQMPGYNEKLLLDQMFELFQYFKEYCTKKNIQYMVIQIARGRSSAETIELFQPLFQFLQKNNIKVILKTGYRTSDYYDVSTHTVQSNVGRFVYLVIGMVARLSDCQPGRIVIPVKCGVIDEKITSPQEKLRLDPKKPIIHTTPENQVLLEKFPFLLSCIILAIPDHFPFVATLRTKYGEYGYDLEMLYQLFSALEIE